MPAGPATANVLLDAAEVSRLIGRLAEDIRRRCGDEQPCFVGIERRGVHLSRRVAALLEPACGSIPCGSIDVSLYRDDLAGLPRVPQLRGSSIPFDVDGAHVVLFDDVIYTGRTTRAALEELMDFGRPRRVELAVFLDRGQRELPLQPDYCALHHPTAAGEHIRVRLQEVDGEDSVILTEKVT